MPPPTVYYMRHGETDWNVAGRLQGRRDTALNARGRAQAMHCGEVLRDLFERDGRDPNTLDYVSSPLARARTYHGACAHGARHCGRRLPGR